MTTTEAPATIDEFKRTWPAVVELVRSGNAMLAVCLDGAQPTSVTERELVLSFPVAAAFNKRKAEQDDNRRTTAEAVRNVTGATLTLRYELAEPEAPADPDSDPDFDAASATGRLAVTQPKPLSGDELVEKFKAEFGAEEILPDDYEVKS